MVGSIEQLLKKLCVRIDTKKLKLESLSGIKANRATFFSPSDGRSSSSVVVKEARLSRLNFSSLAARVICMDFRFSPHLNDRNGNTLKRCGRDLTFPIPQTVHRGDGLVSSSSSIEPALSISITIAKFVLPPVLHSANRTPKQATALKPRCPKRGLVPDCLSEWYS